MLPKQCRGLVIFAHGTGNSRRSPRNRAVAEMLLEHGLRTLLFDLLAPEEEAHGAVDATLRYDVPILTERLGDVTDRIGEHRLVRNLPIGYFGATIGTAAAPIAAAARPRTVRAIVSRSGRPDLVDFALPHVFAPTLLAAGGADSATLESNREALDSISSPCRLHVVPDAGNLFEDVAAVEEVADLAGNWFTRHFAHRREALQFEQRTAATRPSGMIR